jgi:hypothetical protein
LTKVSYRLHALFLGHEDIAENKVEGLLPKLPYTIFAVHGRAAASARLKQSLTLVRNGS